MKKRTKPVEDRALCCLCDALYDLTDAAELKNHQHPEPQSGPARDAWLKSRLHYDRWIVETPEGRAWSESQLKQS